jgi:DNA-binding response OmpR family regulator
VLVVEDDLTIRRSLEAALSREGYEARTEADGTSVVSVLDRFRPDLAILDVRLPVGPTGYEMARLMRRFRDVPVLFLTAADAVEDRLAGFDAGGDDYVLKPFSMPELLARVRALLRRSGRLQPAVWTVGDLVVDEVSQTARRAGHPLDVTKTEYELLRAFARRPGHVLSKGQLLSEIWGFDEYDPNVVEAHVSAIRQKLETQGPRMIQTMRNVGYVMREP